LESGQARERVGRLPVIEVVVLRVRKLEGRPDPDWLGGGGTRCAASLGMRTDGNRSMRQRHGPSPPVRQIRAVFSAAAQTGVGPRRPLPVVQRHPT
jgi:hypothetical protein